MYVPMEFPTIALSLICSAEVLRCLNRPLIEPDVTCNSQVAAGDLNAVGEAEL
jgi:hypothetical protein